jgi:hypothetical protein
MIVKDKAASAKLIQRLGLNRVEQETFHAGNRTEIQTYISRTGYPLYNIRDNIGRMFKPLVPAKEVLDTIQSYTCFSIFQSLQEIDQKNLVLQGDIIICTNMEVLATLSDKKGITLREATTSPKYKLSFNLLERREPRIKGLKEIIDYIFRHELFGHVVEFSLYDVPVGVNQENILVWELRNY